MGYYFQTYGKQFVAIPDSSEIALALTYSDLQASLEALTGGWNLSDPDRITNSESSLVTHVFEFVGFEVEDVDYSMIQTQAGRESGKLYSGFFDSKWNKSIPVALEALAQAGVGFSFACFGEDGEMWKYHSVTGSGEMRTLELVSATVPETAIAEKIAGLLSRSTESLSPLQAEGARVLRQLFPTETDALLIPVGESLEDLKLTLRCENLSILETQTSD